MYSPASILSYARSVLCTSLLVLLSLFTAPITLLVTTAAFLFHTRSQYTVSRNAKTILITGARNNKCLTLARALARAGHRIVVAEEPAWFTLNPTRYSRAVHAYVALPDPTRSEDAYIAALAALARAHQIDVFLPCSSPSYTVADARAAVQMRKAMRDIRPKFLALIQPPALIEQLHWKDAFIALCASLSLRAPESQLISSLPQAVDFLHGPTGSGRTFITKCLAFDERARTDPTPLPLASREATSAHLAALPLPIYHTYLVQRRLRGPEYCVHAFAREGRLRAFVCCRSSDMLMRYVDVRGAAAGTSDAERERERAVGLKAEEWVREFLRRWGERVGKESLTGHFCVDFMLDDADGTMELYPIECNPRAHTAVALFTDEHALTSAYLGDDADTIVRPPADAPPISWIGHALPLALAALLPHSVRRAIHPLLVTPAPEGYDPTASPHHPSNPLAVVRDYIRGTERDGVWCAADPVPAFVLLHLQWPWLLVRRVMPAWLGGEGKPWSRVNVSTSRIWGVVE